VKVEYLEAAAPDAGALERTVADALGASLVPDATWRTDAVVDQALAVIPSSVDVKVNVVLGSATSHRSPLNPLAHVHGGSARSRMA
jgi:hypothetical protein